MENFDQFIETVKTTMQPSERASATANTLQKLVKYLPEYINLQDLRLGWDIISQPIELHEEPAIRRRRATCKELASIAYAITNKPGNIMSTQYTWRAWVDTFNNRDDPRRAAMAETFKRELNELQR